MTNSQRQAVVTLLQKPGKDRLLLQNWRPISLLNLDYKILTKVIGQRIQVVLPDIIHENQSGFVSGRKIEHSVKLIQDIMNFTEYKKAKGYFLFIDFEKAFDSIEWNFIFKALETFNFGNELIKWIKIFYNDVYSCIINNGKTTPYFKVGRGVRQGDPLSPYLFIICTELLSISIRNNNKIKGIKLGDTEIKLIQFADELTCSFSDTESGKEMFNTLHKFETFSGLKINQLKSQGLWLGKLKESGNNYFDINWTTKPVKLLGIYIGHNSEEAENLNFTSALSNLDCTLNQWKGKNLSLKGKVLIVKTLGLSKFTYLSKVLHVPDKIKQQINKKIYSFIWNGQTEKVNRKIFMQHYTKGGYNMHDFDTVDKANKIAWVLELLKSNTLLLATFLKTTVGTNLDLFLRSNFSKQMIPNFHVLPQFYKDMLLNWIEFTNDKNNISSSHRYAHLIWYNTFIYGHNSPMEYFNNRLFQAGLWFVSDLFYDNDKLIPFNIWMKREVLAQDYLTWRGLVTTVRQKSMKYIRNNSDEKLQDKPLVNSSKEIIISMKPKLF